MAALFAVGAYHVVVFPNDHTPAHVHALGPGGYAKVELGRNPNEVALIETDGISSANLRRIVARIIDQHGVCLDGWRRFHGN